MSKPWNGWSDYTEHLPEIHIRPTEPPSDLPDWVEGTLAALIVMIAVAIVLAAILSAPLVSG